MDLILKLPSGAYSVHPDDFIDISIPLFFNGPQPNFYNAPPASSKTFTSGNFTGSKKAGGSCNVSQISLIPHCNGTHTECAGHITGREITLNQCLTETLIPATLITITPGDAMKAEDTCFPVKQKGDKIITRAALNRALRGSSPDFHGALIIRTLPNNRFKLTRIWSGTPPYFSLDAIHFVNRLSFRHLLVDLPSVDRSSDGGNLTAHRIFWDLPRNNESGKIENIPKKTITEMIYIPVRVPDGCYLLNLQVPHFATESAPSRPVLYKIKTGLTGKNV